jgi:prolyl oligopeptidase
MQMSRAGIGRCVLLTLLSSTGLAQDKGDNAPRARAAPVEDEYFGTRIVDPYRWMETARGSELKEWFEGQSRHTDAVLDRIPARKALLERIHALNESTADVYDIVEAGRRYFYFYADPQKPVAQIMVREGLEGRPRLLLDPAKLSGEGGHAEAGWFSASADGKYLAVAIAYGGAEEAGHLRIVDVDRAVLLKDDLPRVWGGSEGTPRTSWLPDNRTFTYTQFPSLAPGQGPQERRMRSRALMHTVGRHLDGVGDEARFGFGVDAAIDVPKEDMNSILIPPGSRYALGIAWTVDVDLAGLYVAPVAALASTAVPWQRVGGPEAQIQATTRLEVRGDELYFVSRRGAPRFQVLRLDLRQPDLRRAGIAVPESAEVIEDIGAAADGLYVLDLNGGLSGLRRLRWEDSQAQALELPFTGAIRALSTRPQSPGAFLRMRSHIHPNVILHVDGTTGAAHDTGWQAAAKVDFSQIDERQVMAIGHDGTRIPLTILVLKSARLDGNHPTLLDSYGAYGSSGTAKPYFDPTLLAWLERGGVFAVAHPRGGGEFGEEWHRAGMQRTKLNTVFDTLTCAQYLLDHGYTSPSRLALQGASAGGLAVGGAITWRPDLFAAAIDHAGLADALRAETGANGPINVPEFGSVRTEEGFHALYAMSPYHHVREGVAYPAVLLETGINDPRVDPWQMAKLTARLQAATSSDRPVLLRVDFDSGHFGGTIEQSERLLADEWSFLLWRFGDPAFQPR